VHFVGLFFVFIIENARSKKQNSQTASSVASLSLEEVCHKVSSSYDGRTLLLRPLICLHFCLSKQHFLFAVCELTFFYLS